MGEPAFAGAPSGARCPGLRLAPLEHEVRREDSARPKAGLAKGRLRLVAEGLGCPRVAIAAVLKRADDARPTGKYQRKQESQSR
jgi:hypothetical protein